VFLGTADRLGAVESTSVNASMEETYPELLRFIQVGWGIRRFDQRAAPTVRAP
jgi:hypothetical protein